MSWTDFQKFSELLLLMFLLTRWLNPKEEIWKAVLKIHIFLIKFFFFGKFFLKKDEKEKLGKGENLETKSFSIQLSLQDIFWDSASIRNRHCLSKQKKSILKKAALVDFKVRLLMSSIEAEWMILPRCETQEKANLAWDMIFLIFLFVTLHFNILQFIAFYF